jgi:hypothetical protein
MVELDDIEWGYAIVQRSIDMVDDGVKKHMSSSDFETLHKTIHTLIDEAGEDGIAFSVLRRKKGVASAKNQDYDGAMKFLMSTDQILSKINTTKGRPSVRYFIANETLL